MKMIPVFALIAFLVLPALVCSADVIREGQWEITTSFEMPGTKAKLPTTAIKHCYTKEEVKDHKKVVAGKNKNCVVTEQKMTGNKATWAMKCTGEGAGTFSGETIFNTESYQSTMKMNSQGRTMIMRINGKRLGNCK